MAQLANDLVARSNPERPVEGIIAALMLALVLPLAVSSHAQTKTEPRAHQLVAAAVAQTRSRVTYDGSYRRIPYPGGDVPDTIGVCTDVVIRAYRRIGVDLQVEVHEDMRRAFRSYPQLVGHVQAGPEHRPPARPQSSDVSPPRRGRATRVARSGGLSCRAIWSRGCCPATSRTSASSPASDRPPARRSWSTNRARAGSRGHPLYLHRSPDTTATPRHEARIGLTAPGRDLRHLSY